MNQVFISYRRELGSEAAQTIYDTLIKDYRVYYDVESIKNGRFDKQIEEAISHSKDLLLLVTSNIFSHHNEGEDYLYKEIECALINRVNIIPIFIDVTDFPEGCPEDIKEVKLMNALVYKKSSIFFDKLKYFITSNNIYRLPVTFIKDQYVLTSEAVNLLFEIYKKRKRHHNYEIDVDLIIDDSLKEVEEIKSEQYKGYELGVIKHLIASNVSRYYKSVVQVIELLLNDQNVASYARDAMHYYIALANRTGEYVINEDEFGYREVVIEPLLWKDVINETLKRFSSQPGVVDTRDYIGIDGENRAIKWYFVCYVPYDGNDKLEEELGHFGEGCRALITDIAVPERYVNVLPDLYWYMLFLKRDNKELFDKWYKENRFCLYNFEFGWY